MARWLKEYDPEPFIERLNKTRSLNEAGRVQFGGFDMFIVPAKLDGMIEMSTDVPEYEKYSIVKQAIWVAGKKRITKESLIKEVNQLEMAYLGAPEKRYVLVTSVSVDYRRHRLRNARMCGCRIAFGRLPQTFVKARKKASEDYYYLTRRIEFPRDYVVARVAVSERTAESAATKALYALGLLGGFLNLANNLRRRVGFSIGGSRKPINEIVLGPLHTLHNERGKLAYEGIWYEPDYREPLRTFSPPVRGDFEKIVNFAQKLRDRVKKCSYGSGLEDAIVRYNSALDSYNWNTGYIELWSVLEYLTNTLKESYKTTIRRAAFIWEDHEGAIQTLSLLRDFRNNLVHKGASGRTIEVFIYDLKRFVEELLLFLVFNRFRFESLAEAGEFLDQPKELGTIEHKAKFLNYARKFAK